MENCLVKTLKGIVNESLPVLGEMKIRVSNVNTQASAQLKLTLSVIANETVTIETPDGYPFTKGGVSMNSVDLTSADSVVELTFYKANYDITVKNKYGVGNLITGTSQGRSSILSFNVEDFAFKKMASISLPYTNLKGDIGDMIFEDKTTFVVFEVGGNSELKGNLKGLFDSLYNAGRTSGTIRFDVRNSGIDTSDMPAVSGLSKTNGTITFSGSGWTQTA